MKPSTRLALSLALLSLLSILFGLFIGSQGFDTLALEMLADLPSRQSEGSMTQIILLEIRLPRSLGAWSAGALLGLAGAVAQGLFRNPLADPYLIGSASGASLFMALTFALLSSTFSWQTDWLTNLTIFSDQLALRIGFTGAAFIGALLAVLLTITLAQGTTHTLRLLLAGVIVGVVLSAGTSMILFLIPEALRPMQAFLLGSTSHIGWSACLLMLTIWLFVVLLAWLFSRTLDALALGEATALSLGLPIALTRNVLIILIALATATTVAQTGVIAFVGLAAPHLIRSICQVTHNKLIWLASLMGGTILALADVVARWVIAPQELPIGILTAVFGGCYLIWLMRRQHNTFTASG